MSTPSREGASPGELFVDARPVPASSNTEYDLRELIGPQETISKCYDRNAEDKQWLNDLPVGLEAL